MRTLRRFIVLLLVAFMVLGASAYAGTGDNDNDGVPDSFDNCPAFPNPDQADRNHNSLGDACDDPDKDGLSDQYELFATYGSGTSLRRTDPDKQDTDGEGLSDGYEVNRNYGTPSQPRRTDPTLIDTDRDGWEDATEVIAETDPTDPDTDDDGVRDPYDNCARVPNSNQADADRDGIGNACDDDWEEGGVNTDDLSGTVNGIADGAKEEADAVIKQVAGLIDSRPVGDLNKMGADGYIVKITQSSASYWLLQVVKADDLSVVPLNLPDLGSFYSVNGPVGVFAHTSSTLLANDQTQGLTGDRINVRWRYSARRKQLIIRVAKGTLAHDGFVTFAVPPVGYPTGECRTTVLPGAHNTCDGNAMGFYNPQKLGNPRDLLDAVPYRTTISY